MMTPTIFIKGTKQTSPDDIAYNRDNNKKMKKKRKVTPKTEFTTKAKKNYLDDSVMTKTKITSRLYYDRNKYKLCFTIIRNILDSE